jgi:hypothetical protein
MRLCSHALEINRNLSRRTPGIGPDSVPARLTPARDFTPHTRICGKPLVRPLDTSVTVACTDRAANMAILDLGTPLHVGGAA